MKSSRLDVDLSVTAIRRDIGQRDGPIRTYILVDLGLYCGGVHHGHETDTDRQDGPARGGHPMRDFVNVPGHTHGPNDSSLVLPVNKMQIPCRMSAQK